MLDKQIREIRTADDPAWEAVKSLFPDMYGYMSGKGLMLELAGDGPENWVASVKKGLGRFGVLFISFRGEEITGFAHGSIRLTPDYLGNKKIGVITHIHLKEQYRGRGTGEKLVEELEKWFETQDVHSIELQVVGRNTPAMGFWEKLGYATELVQYRKLRERQP